MTEFPVMNVLQVQTIPFLFTKSLKGKTFSKKITLRALPRKLFMELLDSLPQNIKKVDKTVIDSLTAIQVLSFFYREKNYSFNVSINQKTQNLFFVFAFLMLTETVLCLCSCIRK